jgi:transcriptional regulator with XRE-family HTH domain
MAKKLQAIPAGNLTRIAASKGCETISAIKEKTGVDRKTLRAINEGKPVKESTLQSIATKLRVPITHLIGSQTADSESSSASVSSQYSEVKLQHLDAAALRKFAENGPNIHWMLQIDQVPTELEQLLLKLDAAFSAWFFHIYGIDDPEHQQDNLREQISFIRTSTEIDECIAELANRSLKICGAQYVLWTKDRPYDKESGSQSSQLFYNSDLRVALSIVPKDKANPIVRLWVGYEPPREFNERELDGIDSVTVDGKKVWTRPNDYLGLDEDGIPHWSTNA